MLADNTRITCSSFNKQLKCVETCHFSSTDFSVNLALVAKLIQYEREVKFHIAGNPTESGNWSTIMVVKQSCISKVVAPSLN